MNKSQVLFILLFSALQLGFAQDGFIQRNCQDFLGRETISYVSFTEDFLAEMDDNNVSKVTSGLHELNILKSDTTNSELNDELFTRVISAVHHEGYELLSKIESENSSTHYYRKEGDKKKRTSEIIMISKAYDGCLLISAIGEEININQLKKLSTR